MNNRSPPQSPPPSAIVHYNDYGPGKFHSPPPIAHMVLGPPRIVKALRPVSLLQGNHPNPVNVARNLFGDPIP